ncbi:Fic family protein [Pseudahrensia aquimaris]|uniref:Fic family protein n=1 Tax=Pseudahrensia aquimaris TaxID=744461 RepID=A0ABW3FFM0_9HYPH
MREDRNETTAIMEPMLIAEGAKARAELIDLALTLAEESAAFKNSLPDGVRIALANLVRSMNCYYSNLIEGHDTHPVSIERALKEDYSADPEKRNLQLEAKAHILVQQWIDDGGLHGAATTPDNISAIHRRFCENVPDELLWSVNPETGERLKVDPGEWRTSDVKVGRHIPISPGAVPRFLEYFERAYSNLGRANSILSVAAAHHRLAWIHPFQDGNGRVARLMTHAMLLDALDTGAIWSVSRGFARSNGRYKDLLAACDMRRRNDLDGRGTLSEEALIAFTKFFLEICLDQVRFMRELIRPEKLHTRIQLWAEEAIRLGELPPKSDRILQTVLYRGELPRGEVPEIIGATARHASRLTSALLSRGVLTSESSRGVLKLSFPAELAARWTPGLFPDQLD